MLLKKASGSTENYEEITYEGYGTSGVAVIVSAATDNKNRTAADVRHAFDKSGGNLGTSGCVSYLFNKKGLIVIERATTTLDEDSMMMLALDSGAEDFEASEEVYEITTDPSNFSEVREKLEAENLEFPAGSGPPCFTAINSSLPNFVNIFPLAASAFPFFA